MYTPHEIVVPVDFSEPSRAAMQRAMVLAGVFDSRVHVVHALEDRISGSYGASNIPRSLFDTLQVQARERMETFLRQGANPPVILTGEVATTDPVTAIQAAVRTHSADLIVVGSRGLSEWKHLFLGSVAERTLRTADCPVLVVKEAPQLAREPIERILLASDFSSHAHHAAVLARDLAIALDARVDVLHAFVPPAGTVAPYAVTQRTEELIEPLRQKAQEMLDDVASVFEAAGLQVEARLGEGFASDLIAREAQRLGADLIVMGTRGHTGLKHIFVGSIAERTIRAAHCSVLTTKEGDRF